MTELRPSAFVRFFHEIRGFQPFRWQVDLVERLCDGAGAPEVIDVPTGFGKTAVIDCWAFALAVDASRETRRLPLRLFLVVDRRLIVDSAYDDAVALRTQLWEGLDHSGPVGDAARALHDLHGDPSQPPIEVVRMRGGVTWSSRWLVRPDQAAVVVGTVDQFGSRLLFRGYGVSDGMRPIDAALTGTDSWLVLDEAHIAQPLSKTVRQVRAYQALTDTAGIRPLHVTEMSATSKAGDGGGFHADLEAQVSDRELRESAAAARQRLSVPKPVVPVDLTTLRSSTRKKWREQSLVLGSHMAELARGLARSGTVVGVVANTISTARAAHGRLVEQGERAILLIGRVREYEREQILQEWLPLLKVGAPSRPAETLFVVATQTIEVGANIDLDALVSEAAPLAALVQRFGRVNRVGARAPHTSAIVRAEFTHDDDPVYGAATAATWEYLAQDIEVLAIDSAAGVQEWPEPTLDFGLREAAALRAAAPDSVDPPPIFTPTVTGAHLERWAATRPAPFPDRPVGPFLHGVERDVREVEVAWRAMPRGSKLTDWRGALELLRPVAWEFVRVPIWEVEALLSAVPSEIPTADLEGALVHEGEAAADPAAVAVGVLYAGPDEELRPVSGAGDVRPGDRVILDCRVGGHDRWGWTGIRSTESNLRVPDVADLAPGRAGTILRLQEEPLISLVRVDQRDQVTAAVADLDRLPADSDTHALEEAVGRAREALSLLDLPDPLLRVLAADRPTLRSITGAGAAGVLLTLPDAGPLLLTQISDYDTGSSSTVSRAVPLREHQQAVASLAQQFGASLNLGESVQRTLELAARLHDAGKADPRFQVMLHDGDELAALAAEHPLAKSGRHAADPLSRSARALAGLPRGFRHEAASADLVAEWYCATEPQGVDLELLHHLVASHHGHARPLMRVVEDSEAPPVRAMLLEQSVEVAGGHRVDWSQPERFERLNDRYGWWGLALLETLIRLADMRCSEVGT